MSVPRVTLLAAIVVEILIAAEPSKFAVPVTSPLSSIALAFDNFVAVAAFPVVSALIVAGKLIVATPSTTETSTSFAVPTTLLISPEPIAVHAPFA